MSDVTGNLSEVLLKGSRFFEGPGSDALLRDNGAY